MFVYEYTGRLHDFHILDMVEVGIESYRSIQDFKVRTTFKALCELHNILITVDQGLCPRV